MSRNTLPTAMTPGFINPRTGQRVIPGKVLGYRRNGQPIHVIAGGSGEGETGQADSDGTDDSSADADDANPSSGSGAGKKPALDGKYDPDRAMAALGKAREDAAREKDARQKAEKAQQEKLDAVLMALGLKPDPKTDPAATAAAVAKELADAQTRLREALVENALFKVASKAGADVNALQDSRSFMRQLADLDPAATDFEKAVAEAVKAAIKANPKLAAAAPAAGQGPARQGADHSGGGTGRQRPALGAAIAARMNGS
ncbi:hypothetical protein J2S43_007864 [Catenuloplanes nepalensis]|uniref:Scaffolding protein n=1 Tax=Catenuloplanes nepalensis TaxID=587533 RepID=A0ABT9N6M4_9ACTN|nr:hypothetical protein [Catenuloplanes nepalensis]MDP9799352.1 hypothetical protein [Catenuloplanes nepalensis]